MPDTQAASSAGFQAPCRGLIIGFRLAADGRAEQPLDVAAASAALARGETGLWLHFDLVDTGAQAFLRGLTQLPAAARAALLEGEDAVHLDDAGGTLCGALPDFHADAAGHEPDTISLLHIALTPGLLVTARRHPLRAARHLAQLAGPRGVQLPPTPAGVLAALIRLIADDLQRGREELARRLTLVEDGLLRPRFIPDRQLLTGVRRDVLRLARRFAPAEDALCELREEPPDWLDLEGSGLSREMRRLIQARQRLEALHERARLAQEALTGRLAEETNRRLFVLSLMSAAMLPASLVAGIFGMNVGGLPGVDRGWGIWLAMGLIAASIAGVMALLRWFRML
jgi:zinc transporter